MTTSSIHTSSHIITLPPVHPSAPSSTLLVHLTHLSNSLSIHVTDAPLQALALAAAQEAEDEQRSHAEKGSASATETEEEARQRKVDEAIDGDLAAALAAAGRDTEEPLGQESLRQAEGMGQPVGCLAKEWAVAMSAGPKAEARGTALFRTPGDVALPMAKRLARRLELPQLLLSLDLPPLGQPGAPETGYAMLSLERGLLQVCKEALQGGA